MSDSEQRETDRQELPGKPAEEGYRKDFEMSFGSSFGFLDLVQEISQSITRMAGFDDEASHWICLSIRESVTNAIQHGNQQDESKKVSVRFRIDDHRILITVSDQGCGFDDSSLPDPLDSGNLLKPSGRGVFFVHTFMDDVTYHNLPQGGFEVTMEKRLKHTT
jgi:serine/threonine-protein kinase RsbW